MSPNLTPKQRRFVDEYFIDLNATQAATRAGYSAKTAKSQGQRLLKHPPVAELIAERRREISEQTEVTSQRVVEELVRIGTADIGKAFDDDGRLLPLAEMPDDTRRAVASIDVSEQFVGTGEGRTLVRRTTKLRMVDKVRALDLLAKHLGMSDGNYRNDDRPVQIIVQSNVTGPPASAIPGRNDPKRFDACHHETCG